MLTLPQVQQRQNYMVNTCSVDSCYHVTTRRMYLIFSLWALKLDNYSRVNESFWVHIIHTDIWIHSNLLSLEWNKWNLLVWQNNPDYSGNPSILDMSRLSWKVEDSLRSERMLKSNHYIINTSDNKKSQLKISVAGWHGTAAYCSYSVTLNEEV